MDTLQKIIIRIYETETGKRPYSEWLEKLDRPVRKKVLERIKRVSLGILGDHKLLKESYGLWEMRIDFGPGYRIYFGKIENTVILLVGAGDKSSQQKDIEKMKKYWKKYKDDHGSSC
jgi:putative addiction module killer protein